MGCEEAIRSAPEQRREGIPLYGGLMTNTKGLQVQEAALGALGSLAHDNSAVASTLAKVFPDNHKPGSSTAALQTVLNLCKSRTTDVSLAACLW
jgi:hypothetical protein